MSATTVPPSLATKLRDYALLMRLDKPVGIWLLLWPTLWGLWWAAGGIPPQSVLLVFVLGTVLMRSAGCVVNDYADRGFDPHVERTRQRPLAAGRVQAREAIALFLGLSLAAFVLVLQLGLRTVLWSVPALLIAASYPYAKRLHGLPQVHLGLAFSWGIPMAFVALRSTVDWGLCALLLAANLCWTVVYDTYYAMVDREDDLKIGVKSSAILFGREDLAITAALRVLALALLLAAGVRSGLGLAWYCGLFLAAAFSASQQWRVRRRDRAACFAAFRRDHWFGAAVFAGLALDLSLPPGA